MALLHSPSGFRELQARPCLEPSPGDRRSRSLPALLTEPTRELAPAFSPFRSRYRRLSRLGEGSQGVVHLCSDRLNSGSHVAVKVARSLPEIPSRLEEEISALWALQGAYGVPQLKALVYQKGVLCGFVTPYFAGETLDCLLERGRVSRGKVLALTASLGKAVLAILSRGYLHRDIKPENILCARDGSVQILDFGLARTYPDIPVRGELSGTLAYASPEQLEGRTLNAKSDLFSLGVVLYELATGETFFPRECPSFSAFLRARERRLREPPRKLDGLPDGLDTLIRRLIVEAPELRAGPHEVALRLEAL